MVSTSQPIHWGILGAGTIAAKFAEDLQTLPDAQLWAIGSRTPAAAQAFAKQFKVPQVYGSYEDLAQDSAIDVIYVATPHSRHKADCILCLEAGKAVLCEKPFTINAAEAQAVIEVARQRQVFCMEAMWMRFIPLVQKVKALIEEGAIGEVRQLIADFGYPVPFDPQNRFYNPKLGGGALLDRGVYPLSLAFMLLGAPNHICSQACMGKTGVDEQSALILNYDNGALALLSSTFQTVASNTAAIIGTKGKIVLHDPFYAADQISITRYADPATLTASKTAAGSSGWKRSFIQSLKQNQLVKKTVSLLKNPSKIISQPVAGNGLSYEAAEVMRCLRKGDRESAIMPLDETLKLMEMLDRVRQEWGLKYPQD